MTSDQRRRLQKLELMINSAGRPAAVIELEIVDVLDGHPVLTGGAIAMGQRNGRI